MNKISKVLVIGSGPIIIGQTSCHSERSEESLGIAQIGRCRLRAETLRSAQGDTGSVQGDVRTARGDTRANWTGVQG
jgi:hypothetical protein